MKPNLETLHTRSVKKAVWKIAKLQRLIGKWKQLQRLGSDRSTLYVHVVCAFHANCVLSMEVGNLHRFQNLAYAPNLNNVNHSWNWIGAQHNLEMKFPTCNMYTYKVRPTPPDFGRGTMCVVDGRSLWRSLYNRSWSSTSTTSTGEGRARRVLFRSLPLRGQV